MDETFLKAALIQPPKILGTQLKPFCAGHALLLEAIDSPFMDVPEEGKPIECTSFDFHIALFFCSRTFEEGKDVFASPDRDKIFRREGKRQRRFFRRFFKKDATFEVEEFYAYIEEYTDCPWHKTEKGIFFNSPTLYMIVMGLVVGSKGAVGLSEAWNMGISAAACYASTIGELNGATTLMPPYIVAHIKAEREKAAAAATN